MTRARTLLRVAGPPVVAVIALVLVWHVLAVRNKYLAPRPLQVWEALRDNPSLYVRNGRTTLGEAVYGMLLGSGGAILLALTMEARALERALMPLAVLLNVTPVIALAPALVVAFGFGKTPKIAIAAIITFFPMLINMRTGLRAADAQVLEVMRALRASRLETLRRVSIPSSLPYFFAAARVCFPTAMIGAVVGEFATAGTLSGLGNVIVQASDRSNLPIVYAAIVSLALLGIAASALVVAVERVVLTRWGYRPARA